MKAKGLKRFIARYCGREIKVSQISGYAAIRTAAKIFGVKMTKVSVQEISKID